MVAFNEAINGRVDEVSESRGGTVVVRGRSECSFAPLAGPAEWQAVVLDRRIDVWRVSDPALGGDDPASVVGS